MNRRFWTKDLPAAAGILLLYGVLHLLGIGCPIRFLTGISCAGCGMTRAWLSVLSFDFQSAFYYHPLWPLVPAAAAVWLLRTRIPPKLCTAFAYAAAGLFLAVYLFRMMDPHDPVVTFAPETGLAVRAISQLTGQIHSILQ